MTTAYNNLTKRPKRMLWVGYLAYLIWMNLLGGWDAIIDVFLKPLTHSDALDFIVMLLMYWIIVFIALWVWDGAK